MREIVALIMLAVLVLAGLGVIRWYLYAGHNWNVAASHIDDRLGNLDGYVVVLYEGRMHLPIADVDNPEEFEMLFDKLKTPKEGAAVASKLNSTAEHATAQENAEKKTLEETVDETIEVVEENSAVGIDDAREHYYEKGAIVYTIRGNHINDYQTPFIVAKNGRRVGFMYLGEARHPFAAQLDIAYLRANGADTVIAVSNEYERYGYPTTGIDAVVCLHECGHNPTGEMIDSTFVTDMPAAGRIEATIISPSYVFTSKIVE